MIKQNFTLRDIEQITGIQSATLRMWKKRYGILQPRKIQAKKLYYDVDDLKYLLNIKILTDHGYRISQVLEMDIDEIHDKIQSLTLQRSNAYDGQLSNELLAAIIDLDESNLEHAYFRAVEIFGFKNAIKKILFPLLVHIGNLWMTDAIHVLQEHFYSHFLRQKLMMATDILPPLNGSSKVLMFLPELELHDISLLFLNYLFRDSGIKTLYLGQSVPYSDLRMILANQGVSVAIFNIVYTGNMDLHQGMMPKLISAFPDVRFIMTASDISRDIFDKIAKKKNLENLELYVNMDQIETKVLPDFIPKYANTPTARD